MSSLMRAKQMEEIRGSDAENRRTSNGRRKINFVQNMGRVQNGEILMFIPRRS